MTDQPPPSTTQQPPHNDPSPDFIHRLFRDNNELRVKINALHREMYNKTTQIDLLEDEIRQLKVQKEERERNAKTSANGLRKGVKAAVLPDVSASNASNEKEVEEARLTVERKNLEIKQLKEDIAECQEALSKQRSDFDALERELMVTTEELNMLKAARLSEQEKEPETFQAVDQESSGQIVMLTRKLEASEEVIQKQKAQIIQLVSDSNKKHNEQQNQLQGVEALVDEVRREYDEFLEIARLENLTFKQTQQAEYDKLKKEFESYRLAQIEEKKKLLTEYQSLLFSMQSQFDEYRTTSEFLFNAEIAKLEDELSSLSMRYEQEIMYIVQAKDKFYADLMVSKDAKIMSLIEGSDLRNILQKHELDMENLRREHAREIERVKVDQESEQKNLVALLQRQSASLESKCEKLQSHIKNLEAKIKEMTSVIDQKNKAMIEKEENRQRAEVEFQKQIEGLNTKVSKLSQEKEHLRHKVIRLNLDARGEGKNSIENMLKRISRDQMNLTSHFDDLSSKYEQISQEYNVNQKKLREREKLVNFLEKEVERRNGEMTSMVATFESFLQQRAKQTYREHRKRSKQQESLLHSANQSHPGLDMNLSGKRVDAENNSKRSVKQSEMSDVREKGKVQVSDLDRGYAYLRRFKALSKAFASGDYRTIPVGRDLASDAVTGPWQKIPLYSKLDGIKSVAKFYSEMTADESLKDMSMKPTVYQAKDETRDGITREEATKLYAHTNLSSTTRDDRQEDDGLLGVSGVKVVP